MMRLSRVLFLALLLALLPASALAAPAQDPQPAAPGLWMDAQGANLRIAGMKAAATVCWFAEKGVAGLTRLFVTEQPWTSVQEAVLTSLRDQMPTLLHGLLFSGTGAGGLVYLALMLAGLCMTLPFLGEKAPVRTERVLVWSVIVVTLFVSATAGYDLIGLVEEMRASTVTTILDGDAGDLDDLVARPMRADDEADLADYRFVLPADFEAEYFPQPEEDAYEEYTILWAWHIYIESEASQAERQEQAATGLALAILTLAPAVVLFFFGLVLAALAAGALVLILFFVVSLPLALFDFGGLIVRGIGQQYLYLCALTLLAAVLAALLLETSALAWPAGGNPDPEAMMLYLPVLLVVALALGYVARLATGALWSSVGSLGSGMQQAASSLAPGRVAAPGVLGSGLAAGAVTGSASLLATTTLAGLTGGPTAALVAGVSSLRTASSVPPAAAPNHLPRSPNQPSDTHLWESRLAAFHGPLLPPEEEPAPPSASRLTAEQSAKTQEHAGASVHQPVGIWAAPDAARQLARATLYPQEPTAVTSGDLSAQYRLHQLAEAQGWNEADLETLYEATRLGQGAAEVSGRGVTQEASDLLARQGTWEDVPQSLRQEASRLAYLASRDAQAERGVRLDVAAPPAPERTDGQGGGAATPMPMPEGEAPVVESPVAAPQGTASAPTQAASAPPAPPPVPQAVPPQPAPAGLPIVPPAPPAPPEPLAPPSAETQATAPPPAPPMPPEPPPPPEGSPS